MARTVGSRVRVAFAWVAALGSVLLAFNLLVAAGLAVLLTSGVFLVPGPSWQDLAFPFGHSWFRVALLIGWTGTSAVVATAARRLARKDGNGTFRTSRAGSADRLAGLGLAASVADSALVGVLLISARWYGHAW
ncbi:hypothetical protein [Tautonia sociabilis]|uniref:Uncharacterized protein n=1 Tax=Tautonia sociabilis TaxID=2080755 RepID=A0A432MP87_9BACT|nr:hypothetical protein [Tautonia sociabilis]RUL88888.1 hypothetical protein TsocGM_04565 [Tautonia sociabilis]